MLMGCVSLAKLNIPLLVTGLEWFLFLDLMIFMTNRQDPTLLNLVHWACGDVIIFDACEHCQY